MRKASRQEDSFIARCLRGEVDPDQIDAFVGDWHARACPIDLADFLGMTWEEYLAWVKDPALLPQILLAHKEHRPLAEILAHTN